MSTAACLIIVCSVKVGPRSHCGAANSRSRITCECDVSPLVPGQLMLIPYKDGRWETFCRLYRTAVLIPTSLKIALPATFVYTAIYNNNFSRYPPYPLLLIQIFIYIRKR